MYDDEEDLALLQQYEEQDAGSSDNDLDSDLEDRIMSAVQYGTDQQNTKERSTIPPTDMTRSTTDVTSQGDSTSDEDSSDYGTLQSTATSVSQDNDSPPILRHIDLNLTDLPDDASTDEEEKELNYELQQLIDNQIHNRNMSRQRFKSYRKVIVCRTCGNPGHMRHQCSLCSECGQKRHATDYCPGLDYCRRCKQRGHFSSECENAACRDSCRHCGDHIHASEYCPSLVHIYVDQAPPQISAKRYCYNCAASGHYGDECPALSNRLQAQLSAFSARHLSLAPGGIGKVSKSKPRRRPNHQRWKDDTDEEDRPVKKRPKSDHRERQNYSKERHSGNSSVASDRGSGNNNWKALKKSRPTSKQPKKQNSIENDFPRDTTLPKPNYSGVVNTERRPKYSGGYNNRY